VTIGAQSEPDHLNTAAMTKPKMKIVTAVPALNV